MLIMWAVADLCDLVLLNLVHYLMLPGVLLDLQFLEELLRPDLSVIEKKKLLVLLIEVFKIGFFDVLVGVELESKLLDSAVALGVLAALVVFYEFLRLGTVHFSALLLSNR